MSLLSWLTGAAKRSAKSGGRSTQTKKKRQKKQQEQKPKQQARSSSKPSQSRTRTSSASSSRGGSSYKPKTYHGTSKPSTRQTNVFQPRTFKPSASKTQTRYAQFKASNVAPKAFKATTKPPEKKQEKKPTPVKGAITKATVSPTTKTKSRFDLPKDYDYKKDLQQAYKKGSKTTYLGTQQKETTKTLKTKEQMKKEYDAQKTKKVKKSSYYKSQAWKNQKNYLKTKNQEGWRKALSDAGWSRKEIDDWMKSEEGMKNRRETYFAAKEDIKKAINKDIEKQNKDIEKQNNKLKKQIKSTSKLKSVNALTRSEFNKMTTASALGKERGNKYLKSVGGDKLLEKIGSKTADAAIRGKFASGVMQGMSPVDTFSGSVGKYNKSAKAAIKKTKGSGAYLAGYGVGFAAQMGMGNVASRGASLAGAAGKGAGKVASKITGKELASAAINETARETGKLTGKQGAKRFAANRAGQVAAETPANIADAAKMAMDEDGKINKKEFKKWLAINSAATAGIGGAMEGVGAAATRKLGNKTVELIAKREAGTITKEESEKLTKYIEKLSQKQKAEIKSMSSDIAEARMAKIDADSAARAKKVAEAEAQNVPKGFGTTRSRGQGKYTARAKQSAKINEGNRRVAAVRANRYSASAANTTEKARVKEAERLRSDVKRLRTELADAEKQARVNGTLEGHARAVARVEEITKALEVRESQLKAANKNTWGISPKKKNGKRTFYHAGDLGKSEWHGQQAGSSRHTGHYGTGTYFGGSPEVLRAGGYGNRPLREIDATDYNLYRPADYDQGIRVHDALKTINRSSGNLESFIRKLGTSDEDISTMKQIVDDVSGGDASADKIDTLSEVAEKVLSKDEIENIRNAAENEAKASAENLKDDAYYLQKAEQAQKDFEKEIKEYGIDFEDFGKTREEHIQEYVDAFKRQDSMSADEHFFYELSDRLTKELNDDMGYGSGSFVSSVKDAQTVVPTLAKDLGKSEKEVREAIATAAEQINNYKGVMPKEDSASTIIMKKLGFEGVDVSGIKGLDNTTYGSVIYDLKQAGKATTDISEKLSGATKKLEAKAKADPSPTNIARAEVAREAAEKAAEDAKATTKSSNAEKRLKELNDKSKSIGLTKYEEQEARELQKELGNLPGEPKAEATEPKKTKYEERQQKKIDTHNERIAEIDGEIANIDRQLKDLDKQGKDYGWQKKNTDIPERAEDLQKGLDSIDALKTSLKEEKWKLSREKTELQGKVTDAEEKIRKINEAKEPEGGYARLPGEEADMVGIKETPAVDKIVKETAQDLDNAPVKPKTVEPSKITENGVVDATTKKKKPLSEIYHNVVRTALFDSLDPLEHIANHLPDEARKAMLAQINEFRRAIKTGRAIVATKGRDIYKRYGLTDRKNKAKMADFERYCFLKHDLARIKEGSGFTGLDEAGIRKEISDLESRYSEELFPVIDKKTGKVMGSELQMYQKDMVNYFRDLLKMEVDAGITSKQVADSFIKRFPNYVPSYREKAFQEILNNHTFEEIDVGRGMKAAKGGGKDPLVSLYNQMQTKTNTVIKRTELNKTLNMLATASGTSEKELDKLVPFFKDMRPEEKAEELMGAQIFPHSAGNGKYTAYMYREGSKIEMNIDKDVYDAIRRWSGEDRKLVVLTKLLNNRVLGGANAQFKKWITDYNLIFGVKNFMRDQATALFYTTDKWGYFKNWPKGLGVSLLPRKAMPEYLQKAYKVYEENGGIISQFIARDSASDRLLDSTLGKYNPLKWVENFNSAMETVPRMTEFVSALDSMASKAAKNGGNYEEEFMKLLGNKEAISKAMYRAKDVTLNFDRSGWLGAIFNRGPVPFFNPAAQGFDKLGRTLIRDNIKYGENGAVLWAKSDGIKSFFDETTMGSLLKTGAYLTGMVAAPEVLYNSVFGDYVNGKVKGYEKQSDYNRNTHFLIPTGDGKFFKLPKARELASLQMMLDFTYDNMEYGSGSTWEKLFGDERVRDLKSMAKLSFEQSGPINPLTDSLVAPLWRVKNNETWYGGKIESGADDERHREEGELSKIWDENTSGLAKAIGKQFNMSPKKVDNVMDSYLGLIYDMGIAQFSAKNDPRNTFKQEGFGKGIAQLTRTPWGNAFFIDSVFSNANKSDYFELVNRREKKLEGMKEGSKEYNELKAQMTKDKNAFAYNSTQYDELQSQIWLDDKMTAAEKRKYCRILKSSDNLLYHERSDGKLVASKDPMAVAWNLKNKDGKRVMSTDKIVDACSFEFKNGDNTIKDAWKLYKKGGGKAGKFMEVTLAARDVNRYAGSSLSAPRWDEVAYSAQLNHIKGSGGAIEAYIEADKQRETWTGNARVYEQFGGSKKTYYTMKRTTTQGAFDLGYDYPSQMRDGELTMVIANARTKGGKKYRDLAYQANGKWILDNRMNAGRCLDERLKGKYTSAKLKKFCDKYKLDPSEGHKWTDKDIEKVVNAINTEYKDDDNELKAAKFVTITGLTWKNPFGEIGDYSLDSDTGVYCVDSYKGYGRRRRRGWRRHGWGHGGGGGAAFNPEVNKAGGAAKQKLSDVKVTNIKVSDTSAKVRTKKSNLNDAYRKKVKKLREQTRHIK